MKVFISCIIVLFSLYRAHAQVQFRVSFDCNVISAIDKEHFLKFATHRYDDQFSVYNYLEKSAKRTQICPDSSIIHRQQFAIHFRQFLANRNSINGLKNLLAHSGDDKEIFYLTYSEYIYQCGANGFYTELDSIATYFPWNKISKGEQVQIARKLYFLQSDFERISTIGTSLLEKIPAEDPLLRLFNEVPPLKNISKLVDSLYANGDIVEANMIAHRVFEKYYKLRMNDELAKEFKPIQYKLNSLGFKVNRFALSIVFTQFAFDDDNLNDVLKYVINRKNKFVGETNYIGLNKNIPLWVNIFLIATILLLIVSLTLYLNSYLRYRRIKAEFNNEFLIFIHTLSLNMKYSEQEAKEQLQDYIRELKQLADTDLS